MSFAYKISKFNRKRKWKTFVDELAPSQSTRVLDVGCSDHEMSETDNFIEKHYPYLENLTALSLEAPSNFKRSYPTVECVQYDGNSFPFGDKSFDICWSNAVIEHVGTREQQLNFLLEIKRVSSRAFITTPNRHFPVEVHTRTPLLHFGPKPIFEWYLRAIGKGWATGSYMNLLTLDDLKGLLRDAGISDYKVVKNRLFGFTLDFVIIFYSGPSSRA